MSHIHIFLLTDSFGNGECCSDVIKMGEQSAKNTGYNCSIPFMWVISP